MRSLFSYPDLPVSRWRNGGGETREIVSYPPGEAGFAWRASIATLAADGDFSLFPGVERVITLLRGKDVHLSTADRQHLLVPLSPWRFAGEWAVHARVKGVSEDFNIMTRRDSWQADVSLIAHSAVSEHGVAWVTTGKWRLNDEETLCVDQGAWWLDEKTQLSPASVDAQLLLTRLIRVL